LKEDNACNRQNLTRCPRTTATNTGYLARCIWTWKVHDQTSIYDKIGVRMCWFTSCTNLYQIIIEHIVPLFLYKVTLHVIKTE